MATTGHESETINVGGLKTTLQKFKTDFVDDSVNTRIENAIKTLDSTKSQTAGTDGLALSITETDGKITSISGSIASGTYDTAGAASTAKTEVIGGATSDGNTLKKLEDRVSPLETAIGSGGSIDTRITNAINALDSSASQSAGSDGLALSITEIEVILPLVSVMLKANPSEPALCDFVASSAFIAFSILVSILPPDPIAVSRGDTLSSNFLRVLPDVVAPPIISVLAVAILESTEPPEPTAVSRVSVLESRSSINLVLRACKEDFRPPTLIVSLSCPVAIT